MAIGSAGSVVPQVLPEVAHQMTGWSAQRDWRGRVRLPQGCYLPRQNVAALEVGERHARGFFG